MKQLSVLIMLIICLILSGCRVKRINDAIYQIEENTLEKINENTLDEYNQKIQEFLYQGKFKEAEPIVLKCLEIAPYNINLLSKKDMVLNGLGRFNETDKVRNEILNLWHKNVKDDWIRKGSPISESTWARILSFSNEYYVIGTEYYTPEIIGDVAQITNIYKILAAPKSQDQKIRLFKLEMSNLITEYYVLCEYVYRNDQRVHIQRIPYGELRPKLRDVVSDLVEYLNDELY